MKQIDKSPRRNTHKIAVADFETTKAEYGKIPEAFCAGIMHEAEDGESPLYVSFWDDNAGDFIGAEFDYFREDSAANQLFRYLDTLTDPHVIYFHNGGRFDIQYFAHLLPSQSVVYIGSRAVSVTYGIHEIRDSAAIVRAALRSTGNKGTIDYALHAKKSRQKHRTEIMQYLRTDCRVLLKAVLAFLDETCPVGKSKIPLTVSSAAFKQLLRIEKINMGKAKGAALEIQARIDKTFRPYYIGGHVEAFEGGVFEGDFVLVDINSMYPFVMAKFQHPIGDRFATANPHRLTTDFWIPNFGEAPYFLEFEGTVRGLPRVVIGKDGQKRNDYGVHTGTHKYHSHELRVALEFGLVEITKIIEAKIFYKNVNFSKYVDHYYGVRQRLKAELKENRKKLCSEYAGSMVLIEFAEKDAQLNEDFAGKDVIAKLFLNGPYGKFAFDCNNYREKHYVNMRGGMVAVSDYVNDKVKQLRTLRAVSEKETEDGIELQFGIVKSIRDIDGIPICGIAETNIVSETYYSVQTAASITAAARGYLLRAIMTCDTPLYCDTDSLICKSIGTSVPVSDELGHWKIEAVCDKVVIAGRKLYAISKDGRTVKAAAKGYSLDMQKGAGLDNTASRIEAALLADIAEAENAERQGKRKGKRLPDESREVKADFMAFKLGGKQSPISRRLQASPDVVEKARRRLQREGIFHDDLYSEGTAHELPGNVWEDSTK